MHVEYSVNSLCIVNHLIALSWICWQIFPLQMWLMLCILNMTTITVVQFVLFWHCCTRPDQTTQRANRTIQPTVQPANQATKLLTIYHTLAHTHMQTHTRRHRHTHTHIHTLMQSNKQFVSLSISTKHLCQTLNCIKC